MLLLTKEKMARVKDVPSFQSELGGLESFVEYRILKQKYYFEVRFIDKAE